MAFDVNKFCPVGAQSRRGSAPQVFSYVTSDSFGTGANDIKDGYFNEVAQHLSAGDMIMVVTGDKATGGCNVVTVHEVDAAGVVKLYTNRVKPT